MTVFLILLFIGTLVLDRIVKIWSQTVLQPVVDMPLWDGVFHLHYAENHGAAFSMLSGATYFFIGVTAVALVAILILLIRIRRHRHWTLSVGLVLIASGAIGNLIDRVIYGYVIDMLYFKLINFAIFNVADMCVCIGAGFYFLYVLFVYEKIDRRLKTAEAGTAEPAVEEEPSHE